MRRRSLREALVRRWMLFAALLSLLFAGITLLLLFVLEDSFIDRRLQTVAATLPADTRRASLPEHFTLVPFAGLSPREQRHLGNRSTGAMAEFRRDDGRYVHARLVPAADGGRAVLLYDVTGELTVTPRLPAGLAYAVAAFVLALLCAWLLANAFVGRAERHAHRLVAQVRATPDPASLEALARAEPVGEFAEILLLHAEVWRGRHAAVERERETLAFLAHELRTPLQSARTSLALLQEADTTSPALQRLQRALSRLERAGNAILWLSSEVTLAGAQPTHAASALRELADELQPLAATRRQTFRVHVAPGLRWDAPWEAVETLLANLLLNAIQHGGAGTIEVEADATQLAIRNPPAAADAPGFGIGLDIARRLAVRIGWQLEMRVSAERVCCELRWPDPHPFEPVPSS
ncbi:HAMP domain-containing histidine kinase [Luteimonas viscosa]|uniref:histidine kinase n=1 Tax=Luteimonas viscosa TaxID=1132694 RepID=A0A5D4XVD8_9GAMM|nr:histidine kinase dimerization/phospho-acceptor domain-containing protein [Luteimonas viscosa]TYT27002.1 HAMP domain-containing histidine kinase [Luteimonas viscosa]